MKAKTIFLGAFTVLFTSTGMCSCNNKQCYNKAENAITAAIVNDTDSVIAEAVPYEGCTIDSKWGNNNAELTIFKKDGKLFISVFRKESKKYETFEVEECQIEGMGGYRVKDNNAIEYLVEDGCIINYIKGEQKDVYEWLS